MPSFFSARLLRIFCVSLCASFFTLLICAFSGVSVVERIKFAAHDVILRLLQPTPPDSSLVFLTLDEGSFNLSHLEPEEISSSPALTLMAKGFPWSRKVYADLLHRLFDAGARTVLFDIHFNHAGEGDAKLHGILTDIPNKIVLASVLDFRVEFDGSTSIVETPPAESILPESGIDNFGYVNFWPDVDGVIRSANYRMTRSEAKGAKPQSSEPTLESLSTVALRLLGEVEKIPPNRTQILRFSLPGAFPTYPLWEVFVPELWAANLKNGAVFAGKTIVIGATAARFNDQFQTPLSFALPGAEIHLNALSCALQNSFLKMPSWRVTAFLSICGGVIAGMIFLRRWSPFISIFLLGCWMGIVFLFCYLVADFYSYLLPLVEILISSAFTGIFLFISDFSEIRREKLRVRRILDRYVSRDIVKEVLDNPSSFLDDLGGVRKDLTILFSDLRGFTTITESCDPVDIVIQLNQYFSKMVAIVFQNGGTIDKFIGDSVMAVWGSVRSEGVAMDAFRALETAIEMQAALCILNEQWKLENRPCLDLRIGIHSGNAIFANIGSDQKMEPTVIGDAVNLASRLEGVCKQYQVGLLFSSLVVERLSPQKVIVRVDLVRVLGRHEPVEIFTLPSMMADPLADEDISTFNQLVGSYRNGDFENTVPHLFFLAQKYPNNPLVSLYSRRCEQLLEQAPSGGWSAVVDLHSK